MKTVSGKILSSKPISLSKASKILSNFVSIENGASQPVSVYLCRAAASFSELTKFHKNLIPSSSRSRSHVKHRIKNYNAVEAVQFSELDEDERKSMKSRIKEELVSKEGEIHGDAVRKKEKKKKNKGPVTKEGEIDGDSAGMKERKKKKAGEGVEGGSGSGFDVEAERKEMKIGAIDDAVALVEKTKEMEKRKGGEIDDGVALDFGVQSGLKHKGVEPEKMTEKKKMKAGEIDGEMGLDLGERSGLNNKGESGSGFGVEVELRKEKKKRKGGEIDGEVALDLAEQSGLKKKKKRRIEGKD